MKREFQIFCLPNTKAGLVGAGLGLARYARVLALMLALMLALLGHSAHAQQAPAGAGPEREATHHADKLERGAPTPAWVDLVKTLPSSSDKSPIVVLLNDTQFFVAQESAYHVHRAILINNTEALKHVGLTQLSFLPSFQRLQLHKLNIRRGDQVLDKLSTVSLRFLEREVGLERGLYSGEVTVAMLLEDLRVGDVIEYAYTVVGDNPVLGGKFVNSAGWDWRIPITWRRVTLSYPNTRRVAWRFLNDTAKPVPAVVQTRDATHQRLRWEERDLAAVAEETFVPGDFFLARSMQFSEFDSWAQVSDWAHALFTSTDPLPDEVQQAVNQFKRLPNDSEKAAAALRWAQEQIRYFSVALGESSHRPSAPAQTVMRRYGDCKDKSLLLVQMLRALGIQARPALVASQMQVNLQKLLPSPYAFDHVVVQAELDGGVYHLDPTLLGQAGRLTTMGQWLEGMEVLAVSPGNSQFVIVPPNSREHYFTSELREKISLPQFDGEATLEAQRIWRGPAAEYLRRVFAQWSSSEKEKNMLQEYEERYPGIVHTEPPRLDDDVANNVLTLTLRMRGAKIITTRGDELLVRFAPSNLQGMLKVPQDRNRLAPIAIGNLRINHYSVEIDFPSQVSVTADPITRSVRSDVFEYAISKSFRGNRAGAKLSLEVKQTRVAPDKINAYLDAIAQTRELPSLAFLVNRRLDVAKAPSSGKTASLADTVRARLDSRISQLSKSIESGKLDGADLAEAHCRRAQAYAELGRGNESLKDANIAVKLAPENAASHLCRASAYFVMGDFAQAIANASSAVVLDSGSFAARMKRGRARFYAGQLEAALDDFTYAATDTNADGSLYSELWRVWTQIKLKRSPSAQQRALAARDPRGDWPRPALALLHGLMSPTQMLELLEAKKGEEKALALVEAHFYLGQHFLAQGQTQTAIDYFKKAYAAGVLIYVEHWGAYFDLKQLGVNP